MSEINDLYRRYRVSRKRDTRETSVTDDTASDEVDTLYQQYRRDRDPDFEKSIGRIMRVARDKIDAENAAVKIIEKANDLPTTQTQQGKQRAGIFTSLFNAPGHLLGTLGKIFENGNANGWTKIALPTCVVAVVAMSMIGYIKTDKDNGGFDLAFVAKDANTLSGYIDASPVVSLGFTNVQDEGKRAFQLGVNSIDLQIATLAERELLIDLSNRRMSDLLIAERDGRIIDELTELREKPEADYLATTELLSMVSASIETSQRWFHWGRGVQSVFYSSQLALESGTVEPMKKSLVEFKNRFQVVGEEQLTAPEIDVARKIIALVDQSEFTTGEYRVIRDSAMNLIALRSRSGN